jgi:class 3 adenylate cyclase
MSRNEYANHRDNASGERRQATVLFADLAGFTAFSERAGEEAAYALMRHLSRLMTNAVQARGGTVKNFTGDGLMALFGVPVALEDAPLRACRTALDIQQSVASDRCELEAKYAWQPRVRIGINTGPMIVGAVESGDSSAVTAIGDTVNFAARLQSFAEPGGIVLSEATYRLVRSLVDVSAAVEYEIKGKAEKQKIYRFLEDSIRYHEKAGHVLGRDFSRITLAEIYIEFLKPRQKVSSSVILKHLPFLIVTWITGKKKAMKLLLEARKNRSFDSNGYHHARIDADLGILCKLANRKDEADRYFKRARAIVENLGAKGLLAKIDAASESV